MRIAIVNDMEMALEALRRVLHGVPNYEVAWVARNGAEPTPRFVSQESTQELLPLFSPRDVLDLLGGFDAEDDVFAVE